MNNIPQLDLHGAVEEEVFDLLDRFLRDHRDQEQALIIVGRGKGIIKKKVIEYLELTAYPWSYERVKGLENTGALVIDLY